MDSEAQRTAIESVAPLAGWLLEGDARKLYGLGHAARGPVLEIGTYRGKSAILMATAMRDAGRDGPVVSLDVDPEGLREAHAAAAERGVEDRLVLLRGTAETFLRRHPEFTPAAVFLDGDHSRRGVARDLRAIENRVPAGAPLLFHDFHDERNADPSEPDYGIPQAIESSWVARDCEFEGVFGCCGLYIRANGPDRSPAAPGLRPGPVGDLGREPLSSWLERRVIGGFERRAAARRASG